MHRTFTLCLTALSLSAGLNVSGQNGDAFVIDTAARVQIEQEPAADATSFGAGLSDLIQFSLKSADRGAMKSSGYAACDTLNGGKTDDSDNARSKGYFGGVSLSAVTMMQFAGDIQDPNAVVTDDFTWGAPDSLGVLTDNVTQSFRIELNPFEHRQKILGEFLGITTGVGFDWWRIGVQEDRVMDFSAAVDSTVFSTVVPAGSTEAAKNRMDMLYARVPVLVSLRTSKKPDEGMHLEAGVVGGYRLFGRYFREVRETTTLDTRLEKDIPINPFSLNARVAFGYGNVSIVAEAGLLPTFEEVRAPALHSGSVGIHFAFND